MPHVREVWIDAMPDKGSGAADAVAYSAKLPVAKACAASMLTSMACHSMPCLDLCHVCRDSPRIHEGWSSAHCGEPQDGEHKQAHTKVR